VDVERGPTSASAAAGMESVDMWEGVVVMPARKNAPIQLSAARFVRRGGGWPSIGRHTVAFGNGTRPWSHGSARQK
jgi:hypothetical protein